MKKSIFSFIIVLTGLSTFAQNTDTTKATADTNSSDHPRVLISYGKHHWDDDTSKKKTSYPKVFFGITFSRFDLGFTTMIDNGSFTLRPQDQFLSYRQIKSSNVGFDVLQFGVKFNQTFKIYLSGGFDWTLFRLNNDITILPNQPVLTYKQDNIDFSKNRFSSSYLRIPLSFEIRTRPDASGNRFHFVFGPDGGFLLNGRVKQISDEFGKQKFDNNYHFTTFRYGGFVRIGYGDFGLFAKYYANDMFENSPAQEGLKNFSFGLTVGF